MTIVTVGNLMIAIAMIIGMAQCEPKHSKKHVGHYGHKHSDKQVKQDNIVGLDWMAKYDELLYKHGNQLNPPRHAGDREGVKIEGTHDHVSDDVIRRYNQLEKINKKG